MYIDAFHAHLRLERQSSVHTVSAYLRDVKQYLAYCADRPWGSTELANQYLLSLSGARATVWRKRAAIGAFFRYLWQEGELVADLSQGLYRPPTPDPLPKALDNEEIARLIVHAGTDATDNGLRKYALITLVYKSAMRVSECVEIRLTDLHHDRILLRGKGGKCRWAFMTPEVVELIERYRQRRECWVAAENPYLWGCGAHKHILRQTVHRWLQAMGQALGMHVSPHVLRHTQATQMLPYINILDLAEILGHADVNVTSRYLRVRPRDLEQKLREKHPLGDGGGLLE